MLANAQVIPMGFIRKISLPSLDNTPNVTNVSSNSATLGSTLLSSGGSVTSIGVKYRTDINFVTSSSNLISASASPGNYSTSISDLNASTIYHARFFATNSAGTTNGDVISFTTSTPPKAVGDSYGGGKIFYILKSGDAGYDANILHGLIASLNDQGTANWANTTAVVPLAANELIGYSSENTSAIITKIGTTGTTYAARVARNYTDGTNTDWYLPSSKELLELIAKKTVIGNFTNNYYWSSTYYSNVNGSYAYLQQVNLNVSNASGQVYGGMVRPIRSF